jgi:hypothetical protein
VRDLALGLMLAITFAACALFSNQAAKDSAAIGAITADCKVEQREADGGAALAAVNKHCAAELDAIDDGGVK